MVIAAILLRSDTKFNVLGTITDNGKWTPVKIHSQFVLKIVFINIRLVVKTLISWEHTVNIQWCVKLKWQLNICCRFWVIMHCYQLCVRFFWGLILPLPDLSSNSPYCLLYNTSDVSSENLVLDHLSIPLLIISFILIMYLLEVVLILLGEILSWSLMRVNKWQWSWMGCKCRLFHS